MDNYVNEYVRVVNSISLDESKKDELFNRITDNTLCSKFESKKQLVFACVAMLAIIVGVKAFSKNNQTR